MPRCFICRGPFHTATGGLFGHQRTPFCGPCVRETIVFSKERTRRRSSGVRFYDHAYPPPPGGAPGLADDFTEALARAGCPVSREVALDVATTHLERGKAAAAEGP